MTQKQKKYDFSGMGTAYNIRCDDGRIIIPGAFDHQDGETVPMVWRHGHDDLGNVLGHAILSKNQEPPGMRVNAKFNDTENGIHAKRLVDHGDLRFLSIWANELKERLVHEARHVIGGRIREVSLVLGSKNPGAKIDQVFAHSHDGYAELVEDAGIITSGFAIELDVEDLAHGAEEEVEEEVEEVIEHEMDGEETLGDVLKTFNDRQRVLLSALLAEAGGVFEHDFEGFEGQSDEDAPEVDLSNLEEVYESLNEKQLNTLLVLVDDFKAALADMKHGSEEDQAMTQSIFANKNKKKDENVLSHDALREVLSDAMRNGSSSLKKSITNLALEHGITDIEYLFPDHQLVHPGAPEFLKEEDAWVSTVMGAVHKSPFSRIKTRYADITADEARAKGYIKGNQKVEEVFPILKRVTEPQTVYKLQKLDRDDLIDITEFDVVVWLKAEMKLMQRAEIARALLVGDGRSALSDDKIDPLKIRPIWTDDDIYAHKVQLPLATTYSEIIDEVVLAQLEYRGTGRPSFYASATTIANMLLLKDGDGRRLYPTRESLAAALDVASVVDVEVMKDLVREDGVDEYELMGIVTNLRDYTLGMTKMGQTTFFDDFDIDFNQHKYLIESRQSGALTRPKAALIIERLMPA